MFRSLTSQLAGVSGGGGVGVDSSKKALSPALRPDIYQLIDGFKPWASGSNVSGTTGAGSAGGGTAGDSVSYKPLLDIILKHLPETKKLGLESFGQAESEIGLIVGGVTNMILELSKWEGMSATMAMRTWVDTLVEVHNAAVDETRKAQIGKGITRGFGQSTDFGLLTKDFTSRISIISSLKTGKSLFD